MSRKPIHFDGKAPNAASSAATQAQRIVAKFGGCYKLAAILQTIGEYLAVATLYRWTYPTASGLIPARHIAKIQKAAAHAGIRLTDSDWSPISSATIHPIRKGNV